MTVGFVPLYDLSNNIEEYMTKSVSHLISTRDLNISPRAKGQRPDIGWGLIWVLYRFWHVLFILYYCTCIFEKIIFIYFFDKKNYSWLFYFFVSSKQHIFLG